MRLSPPPSCLIKLFLSEWNEDCPNPLARGGGFRELGETGPQRPPVTCRIGKQGSGGGGYIRFSEPHRCPGQAGHWTGAGSLMFQSGFVLGQLMTSDKP